MKDEYKAVGSWGTLGLEIALSVILGFLAGRWLDGKLGTDPWISIVGFLFGCGAAGRAIFRTWKEMQAVTAREEREKGNPAPLYEPPADRDDDRREGSQDAPAAPISRPEDDERSP